MNDKKRSPYRTRLEMQLHVLQTLKEKTLKKTHIMYKCNLNPQTNAEILQVLIDKGMVKQVRLLNNEFQGQVLLYEITWNGNDVLEHWEHVLEAFK